MTSIVPFSVVRSFGFTPAEILGFGGLVSTENIVEESVQFTSERKSAASVQSGIRKLGKRFPIVDSRIAMYRSMDGSVGGYFPMYFRDPAHVESFMTAENLRIRYNRHLGLRNVIGVLMEGRKG